MPAVLKPKVYMAGPIHDSQDYGKGWRARLKENYDDIRWVDPFEKYDSTESDDWSNDKIVEDDLRTIDECSAVLAHWEVVHTVGTPMEIFYSYRARNIPVVAQTTADEDDISIWLDGNTDAIVRTFEDAINAIYYYLRGPYREWADSFEQLELDVPEHSKNAIESSA